ncbi:hypothetical protein RVR_10589 [Actinacidiphila reveromycinica]|uniref:Uncharacterized protein n=1 Tax=Actinacidiphila reveromycinica TaxID=659352 RepID=A0A7U3UXL9_9ACTN|nr:hypothetical protein [Streptomyces sp. SN-593]BBB00590.1 hypothetical protein RVR_7722 [Streptomyces sp. SN-593]BBB00643.1 hypothetical protein RVR_10589 [Streptomyces sp. SN-593]
MECTICHRPLPAGTDRYACPGCEHHLAYVLQQLVAELPLLRAELTPHRGPGAGGRPAGRAHPPLPVDVRVLDLLATRWVPDPDGQDSGGIPIGPLLVGWASLLADDYPAVTRHPAGTWYITRGTTPVPRAGGGIPGWANWLQLYIPFAVTCPWIWQMHEGLDDALRRVRAITGTRPRSHPRLAPCPQCSAVAMSRADGQWEITCEACGCRLDPDAYAAHAAAVLPSLSLVMAKLAADAEHHPTRTDAQT